MCPERAICIRDMTSVRNVASARMNRKNEEHHESFILLVLFRESPQYIHIYTYIYGPLLIYFCSYDDHICRTQYKMKIVNDDKE